MAATGEGDRGASTHGWDARLYWLWILYNAVAFVVVLTAAALLAWIGGDVLHLNLTKGHDLVALLVATLGALLFGGVLGSLQWLVIRERVPVPERDGSWPTSDRRCWVGCWSSFLR